MSDIEPIVIAGAGSVGCFVGGAIASVGREVHFLGRARILDQLRSHGLTVTDLDGLNAHLEPAHRHLSETPEILKTAKTILVTTKSMATEEMGRLIDAHAPLSATVISLQNGVTNAERLRKAAPRHTVLAGMVPYNVVQLGDGKFHRGTSGVIMVEKDQHGLASDLNSSALSVVASEDMQGVLWGKLLINLNNALNALSGIPLRDQVNTAAWRRLLADMMDEALAAMRIAGIEPVAVAPTPPKLLPSILRVPNFAFRLLSSRMPKIDPKARSSMWEDLEQGRPTEIDELQGAVVRLAEGVGRSAPINARVAALIKEAEGRRLGSPMLKPAAVRQF
ncbi:MAG: 2-dehydropantoate 2-reductase [Pseudomonadota bacterium]